MAVRFVKKLVKTICCTLTAAVLWALFGPSVVSARPFMDGRNMAPVGRVEPPIEKERGWRRGRSNGPRGNERSEYIRERVRVGPIRRDQEKENEDRQRQNAGNGCPEGTVRVTFAPDNLSFSVLFDDFVAKIEPASPSPNPPPRGPGRRVGRGGRSGQLSIDVMRCHLLIPIEIPQGMRMSITSIDYRGYANIPRGGVGVLRSAYAFSGGSAIRDGSEVRVREREMIMRRGERAVVNFSQRFQGPIDEDYILSSGAFIDRDTISPCGGTAHLRISNMAQINLDSSARGQTAVLTVDSLDGAGELRYFVNWERCTE